MTVSLDNSKAVYQGIQDAGVNFLTALPETWLIYLLQMADDDPHMNLIEVAKEEEAVLCALNIPFDYARDPNQVGRQIKEALTFSQSALGTGIK